MIPNHKIQIVKVYCLSCLNDEHVFRTGASWGPSSRREMRCGEGGEGNAVREWSGDGHWSYLVRTDEALGSLTGQDGKMSFKLYVLCCCNLRLLVTTIGFDSCGGCEGCAVSEEWVMKSELPPSSWSAALAEGLYNLHWYS